MASQATGKHIKKTCCDQCALGFKWRNHDISTRSQCQGGSCGSEGCLVSHSTPYTECAVDCIWTGRPAATKAGEFQKGILKTASCHQWSKPSRALINPRENWRETLLRSPNRLWLNDRADTFRNHCIMLSLSASDQACFLYQAWAAWNQNTARHYGKIELHFYLTWIGIYESVPAT